MKQRNGWPVPSISIGPSTSPLPRDGSGLLSLTTMLAAVVAWSVFAEVSTYVRADGIILGHGGAVVDAVSSGSGKLSRILVAVGDEVEEGQVVAETTDAETMERYTGALAAAQERLRVLRGREAEAEKENDLTGTNVAKQRARLDSLDRTGGELVENARTRLKATRDMFKLGVVSKPAVDAVQHDLDVARRNVFDVMRRRDELEAQDLRRRIELKRRVEEANANYMRARHRVNELAAVIESWKVRSTVSGRVTEVKTHVGDTLAPGDSILSVGTGGEGLEVLIYVSPVDGKRVGAGMPVLVSPNTVRPEEFGSMVGSVESLSEFPSSLSGMVAVLQNQDLARAFSRNGPPYPGRVALAHDAGTVSGFAWTSRRGPQVSITPGTLASVEIEVSRAPPISLVVPWLKEKLGP